MTTFCKDHKPTFHEMRSTSSPKGKTPQSYQAFSWLVALVFLILVIFLYGEDLFWVIGQSSLREKLWGEFREDVELPFAIGRNTEKCNIFDGKWVYDNITRPHYLEKECPYIHPEMTCDEHGRPDKEYLHWRWQPHGCSLPSFNASLMLETLQGKRLIFVGDSLSRGQFISMVCLLHRLIPDNAKTMKTSDSFLTFTAKEYNATIGFYWAPFLVESNSDDPILHRITDRIVREGSIKKHARNWKGADIIVFNTYMWWMSGQTIKVIREPFKSDLKNMKRIKTEVAYDHALRSMVKWVDNNMDPKKSRVFFATMSPAHERSKEWGGDPNGNCYNETTPIEDPNYWGFSSSKSMMKVVRKVFEQVKFPITVLNITQLSDYRKDAHVSIYKKQWRPLTPNKIANPRTYSDCIHWCLPGLQDIWNELMYTKLFFP